MNRNPKIPKNTTYYDKHPLDKPQNLDQQERQIRVEYPKKPEAVLIQKKNKR